MTGIDECKGTESEVVFTTALVLAVTWPWLLIEVRGWAPTGVDSPNSGGAAGPGKSPRSNPPAAPDGGTAVVGPDCDPDSCPGTREEGTSTA